MIPLTPYGERVVDRISMIGMWLSVVVCVRNFSVVLQQYRQTGGKIHLVNLSQVVVFFIHRILFGIIPLFEIETCAYFPLLISLWHLTYLLFYVVMFMRLIVLESAHHSLWIKVVGILLITLRFADWPYELAFRSIQQHIIVQSVSEGATCWVQWGSGVIILNFVGDALANLFLSGMFVRRLYLHIRSSKTLIHRRNSVIERIARRSLICLIMTFVVNLAMNLLKVTDFLGSRSDAFTVYFELVESTLLVEALRVDYLHMENHSLCANCGMTIHRNDHSLENGSSRHAELRLDFPTADSASSKRRTLSGQRMEQGFADSNFLQAIAEIDHSSVSLHPTEAAPTPSSHHAQEHSSERLSPSSIESDISTNTTTRASSSTAEHL